MLPLMMMNILLTYHGTTTKDTHNAYTDDDNQDDEHGDMIIGLMLLITMRCKRIDMICIQWSTLA